jgi:hypothetical protein
VLVLLVALFGGQNQPSTSPSPSISSTVSDLVILVVFGALAFRGWALAQRKWALDDSGAPVDCKQPGDSLACGLFVMRKPLNGRMLVGQVSLWISIFCMLESLEDLIFVGMERNGWTSNASAAFSLFSAAFAVAMLCRAWANAEWCHASRFAERPDFMAMSKDFLARHAILVAGCLAALLGLVSWKWNTVTGTSKAALVFWGDNFDRAEASFLLLASGLALLHWISFRMFGREPAREEQGAPAGKLIALSADVSSGTRR